MSLCTEQDLSEPLLSSSNDELQDIDVEARLENETGNVCVESSDEENNDSFSVLEELVEMLSLGFPLAISFFCRMGMASTDSAFVGHIHSGSYSPDIYLAAAALSDMCVNVFVTPPLAFNQVLNGLVSQAIGSGNEKMAGVWLQQSMFFLSISMLPCLLAFFHVESILLSLDFSEDVAQMAGTYAKYNLLWPIPNGLYQCMRFYFQAQGMPKPAMYNNIMFLFINALLNWIFVFGGPFPNWNGFGFVGAAISLSVSRTSQSIVYFLYMFVYKKNHLNTWPENGWSLENHTLSRTKEFMKQSLPNIGTLLFQTCTSQATTVLVGRLGEDCIASSSALSTVTIPWSGTLSATCTTISSVRTGYHLGRGNDKAAKHASLLVIYAITIFMVLIALVFVPFREEILSIATDDEELLRISKSLVPAMLVGTYLNLLVGNITSGVFSGMGRPIIATFLSFGLELPLSIGGVAIYILAMHGSLLGVYWWGAISGAIEGLIVLYLFLRSDWGFYAEEARKRQEADGSNDRDVSSTDCGFEEASIEDNHDESIDVSTQQCDVNNDDE